MKSQTKAAIALFGGAATLVLAVGFGGSELASSPTTPIADPASSVTPAPPAPGGPDFAAPGGVDGAAAPPTGLIVSPHPAPPVPRTNPRP
ncbi:hypothetical protein BN1232_06408 [Mycobacterium lentiflavum]|uniref:Uncharacterized protein n=1 Tax=Mycobacterium lentiflavum TaxID=141349 RepID=A0A0E4H3L9_MYCLN|nr:hypothetical protein BN1232_06408 [Mycobacterium lentiflavum]